LATKFTRRIAVASFVMALLPGGALPSDGSPQLAITRRQPNIIVILADDLGYADNSVYRGGRFLTPNLDRLAQEGAVFTNAYASAPDCAPSRAALMTGRYQQRFGFEYNNGPAKRDLEEGLDSAPKKSRLRNC
jgi:arylsulfatase A-like enzyme